MDQFNQFKTLEIGEEYTLSVPNGRQMTINVKGDFEKTTDLYICLLNNSDLPDPSIKPIDGNKLRIFWPKDYNITSRYKYKIFDRKFSAISKKTEKEIVSFWSKLSSGTKSILKWSAGVAVVAMLSGVIIHVDKKYNSGKLCDVLNPSLWFAEKADYLDSYITNDWKVYKSNAFIARAEDYKEVTKLELKDQYRSIDGQFFMMKDLVRHSDGRYLKLTWSDAADYCENAGGWLPSVKDQKDFLSKAFKNIVNPFEKRSNVPEWTSTKQGSWGDDYFVNFKNVSNIKATKEKPNQKFFPEDDGDVKRPFRCAFVSEYYDD